MGQCGSARSLTKGAHHATVGSISGGGSLDVADRGVGEDYTFGDWAGDQGYLPGDVMPPHVWAMNTGIDSLTGVNEFDWTASPTTRLWLYANQISTIAPGAFSDLTNLEGLELGGNQISSIGADTFSGLTNLRRLSLDGNQLSSIEADTFSGLTNLTELSLDGNQLSSIEAGDFSGLTNLERLRIGDNQLLSIESGAFKGLTNLEWLYLGDNITLTELNLETADFSSLVQFDVGGNVNITGVSLRNIVVNQTSLAVLLDGGGTQFNKIGIGELDGITEMDLSSIDFGNVTDLQPLYEMDDLTDLWVVDTENLEATDLDVLLDNLEAIEGTDTEGVLYMTEADFDAFGGLLAAWDAEPGHHVEFLQIGDVNHDSEVNGLDVDPFVDVLLASRFDVAADMNGDGEVNGLDVDPLVAAVVGGAQQIPEPSTLLLCLIATGVVGARRKWGV